MLVCYIAPINLKEPYMKVGIIILNSMFLLLMISVLVAAWGESAGMLAGIAILSTVINSVFIFFKVENDFKVHD